MNLIFPYPPKELNPNSRLHWAKLAAAKKTYRQVCWAIAKESGIKPIDGPIAVHLTFYPPDKRHRDQDNMIASMKAGLDGLADAMQINDRKFKISFDVSDDVGSTVKIQITKLEALQ